MLAFVAAPQPREEKTADALAIDCAEREKRETKKTTETLLRLCCVQASKNHNFKKDGEKNKKNAYKFCKQVTKGKNRGWWGRARLGLCVVGEREREREREKGETKNGLARPLLHPTASLSLFLCLSLSLCLSLA